MKTTTRNYRGYIITSFDLRQLGDPTVRGMSYNVYAATGGQSLSASECLTTLAAAREFVLSRIDEAFAEKPDAAADRAFAVYDASLTAAFAAHAAALAAGTSPADADAAYSDAARSAADAYDADISSV